MKRNVLFCCAVLVAVLVVHACAHAPDGQTESKQVELESFMPLAVGNQWIYATQFRGQKQPDLTVSIVKQEKGVFIDNRPQPSRMRFDAHGLRDGNVRYLLKAPLEKGNKWMSVADVKTVERYEIIDTQRTVRTASGTFEGCVTVRMEVRISQDKVMRNDMTFAPSVGMVEVKTSLLVGSKLLPQSLMLLKQHDLKTKGS